MSKELRDFPSFNYLKKNIPALSFPVCYELDYKVANIMVWQIDGTLG